MNLESITVKKGLDIPLGGVAAKRVTDARCIARYAVKPTDAVGFTPRLAVAEGDSVLAGQPLATDKHDPRLFLPSPVDGIVTSIVRGEKRRLEAIVVERQAPSLEQPSSGSGSGHSTLSPSSPVWWMLRERPFGTIANPDHTPKGIFISLRDTNPLAPDIPFALIGREQEFEAGIRALGTLAPVHTVLSSGPHPAGNIGTIVAATSPINKGECIWHVGAQDVANIGRWVATGHYRPERLVAVGGPAARSPHYYRLLAGASIQSVAEAQLPDPNFPRLTIPQAPALTRIVSGSPLSGTAIAADGFLGMYDHQLCLIPEGDLYDFLGWLLPGFRKYSFSRTFLSGFLASLASLIPHPRYSFSTNMHGSVRPFLFTGQFERLFPFDIYPLQLIKACIVGDVELQEQLGIYEVEPEDFALCEFIDPSKTDIQSLIRQALETLRKEAAQ